MPDPAVDSEHEATGSTSSTASTLHEEHALLRREISARANAVLDVADTGRWPQQELHELVNYLQLEVLRQVVDEEWLLFRNAREAPDELTALRAEHLALRSSIEALTQAAQGSGNISAQQLAATTRDLLIRFERHLAPEEQFLTTAGGAAPAATGLNSQPHEWYEITAGPVIDLDALPGPRGIDAALGRLLQLDRGESVELRCSTDPSPLWRRLTHSDPGGWGITNLERGPDRWRVEIIRHRD